MKRLLLSGIAMILVGLAIVAANIWWLGYLVWSAYTVGWLMVPLALWAGLYVTGAFFVPLAVKFLTVGTIMVAAPRTMSSSGKPFMYVQPVS